MRGPPLIMNSGQRLPISLTPLEIALAALIRGLEPVKIVAGQAEASGRVATELPMLTAYPLHDVAGIDGWALRALDLVGASSYSPLALSSPPSWVEVGDRVPDH